MKSGNSDFPIAFSYLRFSTPEQQRGDSFRRQKDMAEQYAREHNLQLDPRSFADLGVSAFRGLNATEGNLGAFLNAVEKGTVPTNSYLLVESFDRISRNVPRKAIRILEDLCEAGITLVTLTDNNVYDLETIDNDPMPLMMAYMVAIRANEESERKSQRLRSVWASKRSKGAMRPMTSVCPAWLELNKELGRFIVLSDRKNIVKRIFNEYLQGKGTHGIAEGLNREGVETFGRSELWHRSYVVKILDNPSVVGRFTPHITEYVEGKKVRRPQGSIEGYYPQVVDSETFSRVQSMRQSRRSPSISSSSKPQVSHLLAGLAVCPKCSSSMLRVNKGSSSKSGYPYLVCSRAKAGGNCEYHGVRIDRLEASILGRTSELFRTAPSGSTTVADVEKRLREERETIKKKMVPFMEFLAEGEVAGVRENLMKLEARLQDVRGQEEKLEALKASRSTVLLEQRVQELSDLLRVEEIDYVAANSLMRQVFRRVVIHWDLEEPRVDFQWLHGGITHLNSLPK